jgi:uncharacterized protein
VDEAADGQSSDKHRTMERGGMLVLAAVPWPIENCLASQKWAKMDEQPAEIEGGRRAVAEAKLPIPKKELAEFCRKYGIRKLSLYGSVLRDDFRPDSDVDVLVEFEPGQTIGLRIIDMEAELSRLFGGKHKVDIVSAKYLNPRLRDRILESAEVQYAER